MYWQGSGGATTETCCSAREVEDLMAQAVATGDASKTIPLSRYNAHSRFNDQSLAFVK